VRFFAPWDQEAVMKKTILTVMVVLLICSAFAVASAPTMKGSDGSTQNYFVYYYHTHFFYHTYYYTPVVYRPVWVAPVYPVYTYHYWYYKLAGR
jgi:hypothetical protein